MEKVIEILMDIDPSVDYESVEGLIDNRYLSSLSILSLVSELEDAFNIEITPIDLIPTNFNSAKAIWEMVKKLQGEN